MTSAWLRWWLPAAVGVLPLVPAVLSPGAGWSPDLWRGYLWILWFGVGAALACRTQFPRKVRNDPLFAPFVLFITAAALSATGASDGHAALAEIVRLLQLAIVVSVIGTSLPDECLTVRTRRAALAAGGVAALLLAAGHAGVAPGLLLGVPHGFDVLLAPLPVLALPEIRRARAGRETRIVLSLFALLCGGLLLTFSRGAWFAAGVSATVWWIILARRPRLRPEAPRLFAVVATAVVTVAGTFLLFGALRGEGTLLDLFRRTIERNDMGRFALWEATGAMLMDAPLLGVGPGNWRVVVPRHRPGIVSTAHAFNDPLQFLAEHGIVGLILLTFLALPYLKDQWRHLRRGPGDEEATAWTAALAAAIAHGLVSYPFHQVAPSVFAAAAMGLAHGRARDTSGEYPSIPIGRGAGRVAAAAAVLLATFALVGRDVAVRGLRARSLAALSEGRADAAVEAARRACRLDPGRAGVWRLLALSAEAAGDAPTALDAARRVAALDPFEGRSHARLAAVALRADLVEEAAEAMRRAVDLSPARDERWRATARRRLAGAHTPADVRAAVEALLEEELPAEAAPTSASPPGAPRSPG